MNALKLDILSLSSRSVPSSTHVTPLVSFCARNPASFRTLRCSVFTASAVANNNAAKFAEASKNGNIVPLYRCIFSEHLTPALAYRCLVREDDRHTPSFLFESVEQIVGVSTVVRSALSSAGREGLCCRQWKKYGEEGWVRSEKKRCFSSWVGLGL